jgi:S-DNA-T family DNA segregation ATPase FtsK/SpoIIIE
LSHARTLSPTELAMHIVDLDGDAAMIHGLPHVASVCALGDADLAEEVVEHLLGQIGSKRSAGCNTLLLVNDWQRVRHQWPELEGRISAIAARGPSAGISIALTTNRWTDLRQPLRDSISEHLELALADPFDSVHPRRISAAVTGIRGRAINTAGNIVQVSLCTGDDAAAVAAAFPGQCAGPVPLLPTLIRPNSINPAPRGSVWIGVARPDNLPCSITLEAGEPHLAVVGDNGSGVSNLLRLLVRGLALDGTRERAFAVVDYRGSVIDAVPHALLAGVAGEARGASALIDAIAGEAARRVAPPGLSRRDRSQRSWWTGPEIYVVVDDDDLVSTGSNQPLAPLANLLAFGHEIGLHLVIARRVNGASRAIHTPIWSALRELGCPAFTLSGDPSEGPLLHGHRARVLPRGRATELRRGAPPRLVQTALLDAEQPARPSTCAS